MQITRCKLFGVFTIFHYNAFRFVFSSMYQYLISMIIIFNIIHRLSPPQIKRFGNWIFSSLHAEKQIGGGGFLLTSALLN